jgi:hypothetical protein
MFFDDYTPDYVALVAVQAAIVAQMEEAKPAPKPPLKNCSLCKGTGKVRTGDNQNWTNCPCTERVADDCPDGKCPPKR